MSHGKFGHLGYLMIEYTKKEREQIYMTYGEELKDKLFKKKVNG